MGGFHQPPYVPAAEQALRAMEFKAGTVDGEPVGSCFIAPMWFTLREEDAEIRRGVTSEFRREMDKATKLIRSGEIAGAHHHTEYMLRDKVKLRYEYVILQARLADTYARAGEAHRAIEMANAALARVGGPLALGLPGEPLPQNKFSDYVLRCAAASHLQSQGAQPGRGSRARLQAEQAAEVVLEERKTKLDALRAHLAEGDAQASRREYVQGYSVEN